MDRTFYKLFKEVAARRDIPASAKVLHAVIVDRIGNNGVTWAGMRTLAGDSGMSIPTVIEDVVKLEAAKLIVVERRGDGRSNHYRLASESDQEPLSPANTGRSRNFSTSDQETGAEALKKPEHNQTDQLNETHPEVSTTTTKTNDSEAHKQDPHAEAFKAAYDAFFTTEPYIWTKADFVQLAKWRKGHNDTPERFAAVAGVEWARGQYCQRAAMTIKGLCTSWATIVNRQQAIARPNDGEAQAIAMWKRKAQNASMTGGA